MIEEVFEPIIFTELSNEELRHNPVFFVILSNGDKAYSKPGRRSWLELKSWLKENPSINIKALYFQFRDNFVEIALNKEGVFFSNGVQCWYGQEPQETFIGGYVENDIVKRRKFILPELISNEEDKDEFPINSLEIQKGLVWKRNIKADLEQMD